MSFTESIERIVLAEMQELEAQGVFNLVPKHEWFIARYRELYDEAMADQADDYYENEWRWHIIEDDIGDPTEDLKLMYQEYRDSYAANEWGDELWERGDDPWEAEVLQELEEEQTSRDMEIDAAIEAKAMCDAAKAEEAYFKQQEEEAKRAKKNREEVQKKWTF